MDLSILDEQIILQMDDSFLLSKPEAMNDDEVTQILKKWNLSNPPPKKSTENTNVDTRTFTRPKRRTFVATECEIEPPSIESGIASINLQVGGPMSSLLAPASMQRSWLNDVSPPSSICTSMDFQNTDSNMLNSLITSSDFSNVSFLLNANEGESTQKINATITVTPTRSFTRNLMDFTFNVNKTSCIPTNATFIADVETPLKEYGVENVDFHLNDSTEDLGKNLTFNARDVNMTWNKIQDHQNQLNNTIVQSTPIHNHESGEIIAQSFDHTMSPISSLRAAIEDDEYNVVMRNIKSRKLVDDITVDDYRNSLEDQCEFLLNEETIKLSSRVCGGDTFDLKTALIQSTDAGKEFDAMLDTFNVKKSLESEKLLQSVDNIKQRHSLINFEKQREDKLKQREEVEIDNKTQYEAMNKSSERLLRRSRLYDEVNIQLQKQQIETVSFESAKPFEADCEQSNSEINIDKNNRDRFKTIKLNKKHQSGMVVVDTEPQVQPEIVESSSTSPGTNKDRRNQLNQQKQDGNDEFKKPATGLGASKLSKFGFSRPTYRSRNELNLPLKANSTDSLDNDEQPVKYVESNLKSPMGVKSKSIHNLMFSGNNGARMGSNNNLRLIPGAARSQSNLKAPRASSLVRPFGELKPLAPFNNQQSSQLRAPTSRKTSLVRPSSGYYGNTFSSRRTDSDNESGCSLSSSSASSKNSVHIPTAELQNTHHCSEEKKTGAIPKPSSGLRPPSNLRAPQVRSGLPRPSAMPIRR